MLDIAASDGKLIGRGCPPPTASINGMVAALAAMALMSAPL